MGFVITSIVLVVEIPVVPQHSSSNEVEQRNAEPSSNHTATMEMKRDEALETESIRKCCKDAGVLIRSTRYCLPIRTREIKDALDNIAR